MSDGSTVDHRTARARELFFNQGHAPDDWLAPYISRSWTRSRDAGVLRMDVSPLNAGRLDDRREAARMLLESAQPELDALAEHAIVQGCVVIVTDEDGVILDEIGSPDFLPKAQRVALLPGVDWSEQRCGTNAIGTVLVERQPLAVSGGEHFLTGYGGLGCAAAPIFTGRGDIAGVLDISGDAVRIDGHTLGLVRMASQQIEHRMMIAQSAGETLRFHGNPAVLGSAREGLLTVVDGQVVAANRIALALLGLPWCSILDRPVQELLGNGWRNEGTDPSAITLPGGKRIVASSQSTSVRPTARRSTVKPQVQLPQQAHIEDARVAQALRQAVKVLDAGVAVLITGETGVGKEVFAKRLHAASRRHAGPLVIVNCAALPESLIEAELFGYDEGAFTGARRQGAIGRIREAQGGILMLDEIGDMPLLLQTRLLRVLEDKTVTPLGAGRATPVDFQLVCATHCDLAALAAAGSFRPDLMFRVNGYEAHLPSLRDREDKLALALRLFAELGGHTKQLALDATTQEALQAYAWPGNVRELVGVLRTVIALADAGSKIDADALPMRLSAQRAGEGSDAEVSSARNAAPPSLASTTHKEIHIALSECAGNVVDAANRLGVHRSTVYRHLRRQAQSTLKGACAKLT